MTSDSWIGTAAKVLCLCVLPLLASPILGQKSFDPKRDAMVDFESAKLRAVVEHKNILLDFGANWCPACLQLDALTHEQPEITQRLDTGFIVLHVNTGMFSDSKPTATLRKHYPKFRGVPHLIIVSSHGDLLKDFDYDRDIVDMKAKKYRVEMLNQILTAYTPLANPEVGGTSRPGEPR